MSTHVLEADLKLVMERFLVKNKAKFLRWFDKYGKQVCRSTLGSFLYSCVDVFCEDLPVMEYIHMIDCRECQRNLTEMIWKELLNARQDGNDDADASGLSDLGGLFLNFYF